MLRLILIGTVMLCVQFFPNQTSGDATPEVVFELLQSGSPGDRCSFVLKLVNHSSEPAILSPGQVFCVPLDPASFEVQEVHSFHPQIGVQLTGSNSLALTILEGPPILLPGSLSVGGGVVILADVTF